MQAPDTDSIGLESQIVPCNISNAVFLGLLREQCETHTHTQTHTTNKGKPQTIKKKKKGKEGEKRPPRHFGLSRFMP